MAEELRNISEIELLPGWQRLGWIAGIWALSVGLIVMLTLALRALLS